MSWDPRTWKLPLRVLLALATIWPIIYIGLFMVLVLSGVMFGAMFSESTERNTTRLDLLQLEKKIQAGEIKELRVKSREIEAIDRNGRAFQTDVENESTREEIIRQAREFGPDKQPRVAKIQENTSEPQVNPIFPVGVVLFFICHMLTILLMFVLMPLYIIFPLKNERLDQTMRIVWVVLACTVGVASNPVYWYLYVWRKPSPAEPA